MKKPNQKLSDLQVERIILKHDSGTSVKDLACSYKVHESTIRAIIRGDTRRDVWERWHKQSRVVL